MSEEIRLAVREMKQYLYYGERKFLREKYRISESRAANLLNGRTKITEADMPFINECYDRALPRKNNLDKLKQFSA